MIVFVVVVFHMEINIRLYSHTTFTMIYDTRKHSIFILFQFVFFFFHSNLYNCFLMVSILIYLSLIRFLFLLCIFFIRLLHTCIYHTKLSS